MKCKHCNGTGKIRGYFYEKTDINKWEKVWGDSPCEECDGTGKIEITNEEWFCGLSTEEKATFLAVNKLNFDYQMWIEWLREIHK